MLRTWNTVTPHAMAANTSKTTHTRTGVSDDGLEAACPDRYCPAVAEVPSLIPVMVTHPVARCALCASSQCLGYDFAVDIHGLHRFIFSCSASVDMGDHETASSYSSCLRHQAYGGVCGHPAGESSHSS